MEETAHDPDKRELLRPGGRTAPARPMRVLGRLVLFLVFLAGFLYIGLLWGVRSESFLRVAEEQLIRRWALPIQLAGCSLSPDLTLTVTGVTLPGERKDAGMELRELHARVNWMASLRSGSLEFAELELTGLRLRVVETDDGRRLPETLLKKWELDRWKVFVEPETAMTEEELEDVEAAEAETKRMELVSKGLQMHRPSYAVRIRDAELLVKRDDGEEILHATALSYDLTPGAGGLAGRNKVTGSYRMNGLASMKQSLRLEWVDEQDTLYFIQPLADQSLLRWIHALRDGPVVEVREPEADGSR